MQMMILSRKFLRDDYILPSRESPEEDKKFEDVVVFFLESHGLGHMKRVVSKALASLWAKAVHAEEQCDPSFALPLSGLAMALREQANASLESMGERLASSYVPLPSAQDHWFYRLEGTCFTVPLDVQPGLT